jgi:hypothetical protein
VHVGFVYSLPELYSIISSKAIKVPRRVQWTTLSAGTS